MDASAKAQEEAEPIKSELDAVQKQLEIHKVRYTFVLNVYLWLNVRKWFQITQEIHCISAYRCIFNISTYAYAFPKDLLHNNLSTKFQ